MAPQNITVGSASSYAMIKKRMYLPKMKGGLNRLLHRRRRMAIVMKEIFEAVKKGWLQ